MNPFSYDGVIGQFFKTLGEILALNFCFMLCCVPVVTAGASVTALYSVYMNSSVESGMLKRFFKEFAANFRQSTVIWLCMLVFGYVVYLDFYFLNNFDIAGGGAVRIAAIIVAVLYVSILAFVFPLQAHYSNKVSRTLRNAVVLGVSLVIYGVLASAIFFFPVIVLYFSADVFVYILPVWLLVGFTGAVIINSRIFLHVFNKLQPKDKTGSIFGG